MFLNLLRINEYGKYFNMENISNKKIQSRFFVIYNFFEYF